MRHKVLNLTGSDVCCLLSIYGQTDTLQPLLMVGY